jgi:hypothetical protein
MEFMQALLLLLDVLYAGKIKNADHLENQSQTTEECQTCDYKQNLD